jgi:hypothetical protein
MVMLNLDSNSFNNDSVVTGFVRSKLFILCLFII